MAAIGELLVWAIDRNPGGIRSIRSPCDIQTTVEPPFADSVEEIAAVVDRQIGTAIFPMLGLCHLAAGEMRDQLHAVTDAEDRDALLEELFWNAGRLLLIDA